MPVIDTQKYARSWWVHEEDDTFYDGEEYFSESEAEDAAINEAEDRSSDYVYVVTEVLTRELKRTQIERKIVLVDA